MKVRILKSLLSKWGAMVPGMTITIPEHVAMNWIRQGIAEQINELGQRLGPVDVPEGMFWCLKHEILHKLDSSKGQKCHKEHLEEAKATLASAEAEAEESARAAAKSKGIIDDGTDDVEGDGEDKDDDGESDADADADADDDADADAGSGKDESEADEDEADDEDEEEDDDS